MANHSWNLEIQGHISIILWGLRASAIAPTACSRPPSSSRSAPCSASWAWSLPSVSTATPIASCGIEPFPRLSLGLFLRSPAGKRPFPRRGTLVSYDGNACSLPWERSFPTVEPLVSSYRKRSFPPGGDGRFLCGERVSSVRGGDGRPVVPYLMRKCQDRNV